LCVFQGVGVGAGVGAATVGVGDGRALGLAVAVGVACATRGEVVGCAAVGDASATTASDAGGAIVGELVASPHPAAASATMIGMAIPRIDGRMCMADLGWVPVERHPAPACCRSDDADHGDMSHGARWAIGTQGLTDASWVGILPVS
jgi:hypothetical protein